MDKVIVLYLIIAALIISGATAIVIQQNKIRALNDDLEIEKINLETMADSTRKYKTRSDQLGSEKLALQLSAEDAEERLEELGKEKEGLLKELRDERGNVEQLTSALAEAEGPTIEDVPTIVNRYPDGELGLEWSYDDEGQDWYRYLEGETKFYLNETGEPYNSSTTISSDILRLKLITGVREENNRRTIFVRSSYPYIEFTNLEGAVIDREYYHKTSRFSFGLNLSYGFNGKKFSPYLGAGLQYRIFSL